MAVLLAAGCGSTPTEPDGRRDRPVRMTPEPVTGPAVGAGAGPIAAPVMDSGDKRSEADFFELGTGTFVRSPQAPAPSTAGKGEVTLNFENTNLLEVVKVILGDLLNENYVVDPLVQGGVTLQTSRPLTKDALLPTLEMLLRMNGASLVYDNGLYNIVPRENAVRGLLAPQLGNSSAPLPRGHSVRIVPLAYVSAAEMQKILEPFAGAENIVRVDTRRNILILAGTNQELARLLETIQVFDVDWLAGMSVALFTPDFVEAETLAEELGKVFGAGGAEGEEEQQSLVRFVTIERLNALLVVTPRAEYLRKVAKWVDRLDKDTGGAGRRLFIYHVQNGKAVEIAEVLSQVFETEGETAGAPPPELAPGREPVELSSDEGAPGADGDGDRGLEQERPRERSTPTRQSTVSGEGLTLSESGKVRIIADEPNNALLIMATEPEFRQVESALRELDITPLQVLIEATIAEITLTDDLQYGLEWAFENGFDQRTGNALLDLGAAGIGAITPGFSYALTNSAGAVRAVLNALATDSKLNIVSSPSLMVLNNQTANIQVGDEVPIVTQQRQSVTDADAPLVNNVEFRDTGVLLSVTPRVNAGGLVTMEIEQEVSDVTPDTTGSLTPTIFQREVTTSVAVQSGETVILGGLIEENKRFSETGIPYLSKLPVIGALFGQTTIDQDRTELVVLITPRVVRNVAEAREITEEFRDKMQSLKPFRKDEEGSIPGIQSPTQLKYGLDAEANSAN